ncbi:helix-turn-helix domain-containing protein [Streptomyces sp. NPDC020192]|uniref:helix-turn-helix domain-containing protein n=1 Tax=Streptomyces sp. NPDC020192 TaxID=3365066 RepID=UPI003792D3C9
MAAEAPLGDLGRRLAARRTQLGLTRDEVAARADLTVGFPGSLIRLAEVLETTVTDLTGGAVDLPPGPGRAAREPRFTKLGPAECRVPAGLARRGPAGRADE